MLDPRKAFLPFALLVACHGGKVNGPEETIETPDSLFVPVEVGGDSKAELEVEWVKRMTRREGIDTNLSLSVLKIYMESGKAPPHVAKKLEEVLTLKARVGDIDREVSRLQKQHNDISCDQVRVRKNLKMLAR